MTDAVINLPLPDERDHARLGPSGGSRWVYCPGSVALEKQFRASKKTVLALPNPSEPKKLDYSMEGTLAHAMLEYCLVNRIVPDSFPYTHIGGFEIPEDMRDAVNDCYIYVMNYLRDCPDALLLVESRSDFGATIGRDDLHGTADIVIINERLGEVVVADYKHGAGVSVYAKDNIQAIIYMLGIVYPSLDYDTYNIGIIQPRSREQVAPVDTWFVEADVLKRWANFIGDAAAATDNPNAPRVPGKSQCRWCAARAICVELEEFNLELAQVEFEVLNVDTALKSYDFIPPPLNTLDIKVMTNIHAHAEMITGWLRAIAEYLQETLERGGDVQGYKLVQKRAYRKWVNDEDVTKEALLRDGLEEDTIMQTKMLGVPAIEKQAKAIMDPETLKAFYELIHKPDTGLTMAPESDRRKSVTPHNNALEDFETLDVAALLDTLPEPVPK